jgi:hypothetical protein
MTSCSLATVTSGPRVTVAADGDVVSICVPAAGLFSGVWNVYSRHPILLRNNSVILISPVKS